MKLIIDIPKEFEKHFYMDQFEVSLHRLFADIHSVAGLYERELVVMLIESFKKAKAVDDTTMNELAKAQWILCSEKLPKEEGYYLVTRKNPKGHVTRVRFNPKYLERGTYNSPWGNGDCDILAWMPLPQAYEPQESEDKEC